MLICKEAKTKNEKEEAYRLRYKEYLKVGHIKPTNSEILYDNLEDCSTTFIAIESQSSKIIGTLRITPGDKGTFESYEYIEPYITSPLKNCAELSKMVVEKNLQKLFTKNNVSVKLIKVAYQYCIKNDIEDVFLVTIDNNAKIYEKIGFKRVSPPFYYEKYFREHWVLKLELVHINKFFKYS